MSFSRVNPGSWAVGDKLTSAQSNALDIDHANAVDKTTAGDTISGPIIIGGNALASLTISPVSTNGLVVSATARLAMNGTMTCSSGSSLTVNAACTTSLAIGTGSTCILSGTALLSVASTCSTQVTLGSGSFVATSAGTSGQITLGNSGVTGSDIKFASNQSRVILYGGNGVYFQSGSSPLGSQGNFANGTLAAPNANGGAFATSAVSGVATPYTYLLRLPGLHNGARFASATLSLVPNNAHTLMPTMPAFGIYRDKSDGTVSAQALLNGAGYVQLTAPGALAGYNGTLQQWTLTAVQNNAPIDTAGWTYYAVIWDEGGANAKYGANYVSLAVTCDTITDMRFQ